MGAARVHLYDFTLLQLLAVTKVTQSFTPRVRMNGDGMATPRLEAVGVAAMWSFMSHIAHSIVLWGRG